MKASARHFGMDVIRASAIVMVLVGHSLVFLAPHYEVSSLLFFAVFGVELFFALSGFLIGRILIDMAERNIHLGRVWLFWLKRWLRTIPAYVFIVIVTVTVTGQFNWSQWFFVQNYFPGQLETFPTSWSLTIEEWFYLLFPLTMLAMCGFRWFRSRPRAVVMSAAAIFILLAFCFRLQATTGAPVLWDIGIRKQIHLRLDAIAFGVMLAVWHASRPLDLLNRVTNAFLWVLGVVGVLGCWQLFNNHVDVFSGKATVVNAAVFYPATSLAATALTGALVRYRPSQGGKLSRMVYWMSLTSYSLYLVHFQIFVYLSQFSETWISAWLLLFTALIAMCVAGGLLYRFVEKPFMEMRRRLDPDESISTHFGSARR